MICEREYRDRKICERNCALHIYRHHVGHKLLLSLVASKEADFIRLSVSFMKACFP